MDLSGCSEESVTKAITYWSPHILRIFGDTVVAVSESTLERLQELQGSLQSIQTTGVIAKPKVDAALNSLHLLPIITAMLTNLGPQTTVSMHQTLTMVCGDTYSLNEKELDRLLQYFVVDLKLDFVSTSDLYQIRNA